MKKNKVFFYLGNKNYRYFRNRLKILRSRDFSRFKI